MIIGKTNRSLWSYLVSLLLLGIVSSFVLGGYRSYIAYTNAIDPLLQLNNATLRFFTKEYIQRRFYDLVVEPLPEKSEFPSFHLFADEQDIESLNSELPASGKTRFISGHLQVDKPEFSSEIQYRYRGGLPLHWLYKKKSLRIKLPPFTTFRGERQFNLVNPSTIHTVTDWISYNMSRSIGLLTPEYFPARVFINNETNGLHYFLSRIDESFLRKNKRMPGSIYEGDTIYVPNPFGADKTGYETSFLDEDGLPRMWKDERLWDKGAARNAESKNDRRDIARFIEIVNLRSPLDFMDSFEAYFDKEKYYLFWGLDTLVGSYHHDLFHNHKIYFDPYKGKFEPIEWDLRFWSNIFHIKDIALNPFLKQIILNPILEHERDLVTYSLMSRFPVAKVVSKIEDADNRIRAELAADPMRQAPDHRYGRFGQDKEVPFSMDEYDDAIEELKLTYQNRQKFLQKVLNYSVLDYSIAEESNGEVRLSISVNGNSAVNFSPWQIIPQEFHTDTQLFRQFKDKLDPIAPGAMETLYPGRMVSSGNVFNRTDSRAILAYGKDKLLWSPLHYNFLIKGTSTSLLNDLSAMNAITNKPVNVQKVDKLPSDKDTNSVHPWYLMYQNETKLPEEVILSGENIITEDKIFTKMQAVTILPGTTFRLAKGKSLVFYGKVSARGESGAPIIFTQYKKGEPWGSVVVQGQDASYSVFSHIEVEGGSTSRHRLIDYPGQFNIHDLKSFSLSNCLVKSNQIGDDALHVAYSRGEIKSCRFENTAFDALDMDIAEVSVSASQFVNIGNDALDLMTSKISIENVSIDGAGDKCVSTGEESVVSIKDSKLKECLIGIAVKDQSQAYVENTHFLGLREKAVSLYQKNPRYGVGGTISGSDLYGITEDDILAGEGSRNLIPGQAYLP